MRSGQYDISSIRMAQDIANVLRHTPNASFSFYKNESLISDLSMAMSRRASRLGMQSLDMTAFRDAWGSCEFLLFAELFDYIVAPDTIRPDWIAGAIRGEGKSIYHHQMDRFNRLHGSAPAQNYACASDLQGLFSSESHLRSIYWAREPEERHLSLLEDARWRLADLVAMQADLPGVNSLVRTGLVKSLCLSDGSWIVAKRDNPDKPGRFVREQQNIVEIVSRLGLPCQESSVCLGGNGPNVQVIRPFSVFSDREENVFYSLSRFEGHPTLEFLLLQEKSEDMRHRYLAQARAVLEHLYEKGIVWGDMAPRNILVSEQGGETTFHLLDFEKTTFIDGPVPLAQRLEHARGPMCVEEFGAVCAIHEVTDCFAEYFDPASWPCDDGGLITYDKPKREVIDILAAKGNAVLTFGEYNRAEREMLDVRFPFTGNDGHIRLPLHASFKIDHYLGAEYDRKTTQLFMNARACGLLERAVDAMNNDLQRLENRLVFDQFIARLIEVDGNESSVGLKPELETLARTIDSIYVCGTDWGKLVEAFGRLNIREHFHLARTQYKLQKPAGHTEARTNWSVVGPRLLKFVSRRYPESVVVTLHGGGARQQFSGGSDLDIAVISVDGNRAEAKRIERKLGQFAQDALGLSIDFFPPLNLGTLDGFIRSQPDCFLDFLNGVVLCGSDMISMKYEETVATVLDDPQYIETVRTYYGSELESPSIKGLLKVALVAEGLGIDCPSPLLESLQAARCAEGLGETKPFDVTGADVEWIMAQVAALRRQIADKEKPRHAKARRGSWVTPLQPG